MTDIIQLLKQLSHIIDGFRLVNWRKTCFSTQITKPIDVLQNIMNSITTNFENLEPCNTLEHKYEFSKENVGNDLKSIYGILADPEQLDEQEVKNKLQEIREYLITIDNPLDTDIPTKNTKKHKHRHHRKMKDESGYDYKSSPIPIDQHDSEEEEFNDFNNIQTYKIKKSDYTQDPIPFISTKMYRIYTGKLNCTKEDVTITVLNPEKSSEEKFKRLYNVLTAVHHPNLETFIGAVESPLPYSFVTRRIGQKLRDILTNSTQKNKIKSTHEKADQNLNELLPGQRTIIAFDVASAMAYLHSLNIIHRDLSCSTILVSLNDSNVTTKITNFANSRFLPDESSTITAKPVSSSYFIAPELTIEGDYNGSVDVFSFGGILYELAVGKPPFAGFTRKEVENKIEKGERPPFPDGISNSFSTLIRKCWSQNPSDRPSFAEIVDTMLTKKISVFGDEGTEIVNKFYSSKNIKNNNLKNCIDIFETICQQIQNSELYSHECVRIRPLLLGYRCLLQTSEFATQEEVNLSERDYVHLGYLRVLLENLSNVISMTNGDKWSNIAWDISSTEISKNIHSLMEQIYVEMTELGFTVTKYDYSNSDLLNDYRILYLIFSEHEEEEEGRAKLLEIENFMKERNIEISTREKVTDERIKNILVKYKDYRIDKNDFEKLNNIGYGVSASVFSGKQKSTGKFVAIKEFKKDYLENENAHYYLKNEIFYLCQLHNDYLVKFIGFNNEPGEQLWLVTEYYENGNLYYMIQNGSLDPFMKTKIAFEIAQGMKFLHSKRVIHRDLKTLNILMDKDNNPKIADFGYARNNLSFYKTNRIGTSCYMAPEVILGNFYDYKADVFSYGMILYELYSNDLPYSWIDSSMVEDAIIDKKPLQFNYEISDSLKKLIFSCLEYESKRRPSFEDIVYRMIEENISFIGSPANEVLEMYREKKEKIEKEKKSELKSHDSSIFNSQILDF